MTANICYGQDSLEYRINQFFHKNDNMFYSDLVQRKIAYEDVLDLLPKYISSKSQKIRSSAYTLGGIIVNYSEDEKIKKRTIDLLVSSIWDDDAAVAEYHTKKLLDHEIDCFSEFAKNEINRALKSPDFVDQPIILLAGLLNLSERDYIKQSILNSKGTFPRNTLNGFKGINWGAHLALSRMGDKESLLHVIETIQKEHVWYIVSFRLEDLAYIRQDKATNIIVEYLFDDGFIPNQSCSNNNHFHSKSPFSHRALTYLARILKDFPVSPNNSFLYTKDEVESARKWVRNLGKNPRYNYIINTY